MTLAINTLVNSSTFGEWKDITNAMGNGFDKVLTLNDAASLNNGNLALTGNITSTTGTLSVGTITHGTLVNITQKTNVAETLQIVKSTGSAAQLWFAKTPNATDAWKVSTNTSHTQLQIVQGNRSFVFRNDGIITSPAGASGFTFDSGLVPQSITGNAATASTAAKWTTARTITLGGDATGNVTIDGSAGATLNVTVVDGSHSHIIGDVDGLASAFSDKLNTAGGTITGPVIFNDSQKLSFGTSGTADSAFYYAGGSNILRTDLGADCTKWQIRDGTATIFTFNDTGSFVATDDITAFSDRTLKENIISIPNALDKVCAIGGYTFDRTDIVRDRQTGVIAQEVLEVLPEAVHQNEDGIYSVAYGNMVGLLVEAIKELKSEVDELRSNA